MPAGKDTYELADGQSVELKYGFYRVNVLGAETVAQVISVSRAASRFSALVPWKTLESSSIPARKRRSGSMPKHLNDE